MVANAPDGFTFAENEFMAHGILQATQRMRSGFTEAVKPYVVHFQSYLSPYYNHAHILLDTPKQRKFHSSDFDLVHSGQSLLNTNLPYVVDFEHVTAFCGYNQYALKRPGFVRALERILLDRNLKKLLAWSDAAAKSLTSVIQNEELARKVETLYPVMVPVKRRSRSSRSFNFLFIGNNFYAKGGYESLLAFEQLASDYDCHFTAIGDIPQEVYARFGNNSKITLSQRVPYAKIAEFYSNSDVFVFPTHYDTYGFVMLEALSFGLPVIGVDSFSTPELVQHEKTGLLIRNHFSSFADDFGYAAPTQQELKKKRIQACMNPPQWYVKLLSEAMARMINDHRLRDECSRNAITEITQGRLSPKRSREQLKRVYEEALNV